MLESHIKEMRAAMALMTEHPSNKSRLFVTNEDIVRMQSTGSDTIFAVTAPQGTTLEIPDPDENPAGSSDRRYRSACSTAINALASMPFNVPCGPLHVLQSTHSLLH